MTAKRKTTKTSAFGSPGRAGHDSSSFYAGKLYDSQLQGGIYEGPVGIMSAENFKRYTNKYYTNQTFWDYMYDMFNNK